MHKSAFVDSPKLTVKLSQLHQQILREIPTVALLGKQLAGLMGRPYDSRFRKALAELTRDRRSGHGIGHCADGYYRL